MAVMEGSAGGGRGRAACSPRTLVVTCPLVVGLRHEHLHPLMTGLTADSL